MVVDFPPPFCPTQGKHLLPTVSPCNMTGPVSSLLSSCSGSTVCPTYRLCADVISSSTAYTDL